MIRNEASVFQNYKIKVANFRVYGLLHFKVNFHSKKSVPISTKCREVENLKEAVYYSPYPLHLLYGLLFYYWWDYGDFRIKTPSIVPFILGMGLSELGT